MTQLYNPAIINRRSIKFMQKIPTYTVLNKNYLKVTR